MSDDFGTVNLRRGDRTREIEVLRKHRESLVKMLADVDQQLRELELSNTTTPVAAPPAAPPPPHPALRGSEPVDSRPLVTTPDYDEAVTTPGGGGLRVALILGAALLALALIGWLIWRASSDRPAAATGTVVEESTAVDTAAETTTTAPATAEETDTIAPASRALIVSPRSHDYGLVRKGTRATRQYEIANTTDEPITVSLARSACRCLYYEYNALIPPKAKESVTVTVDGAKAKAGTLRESIRITAKSDASVATSLDVIATVR